MLEQLKQVAQFHQQIGASIAASPQLLPGSRLIAQTLATQLRDLMARTRAWLTTQDCLIERSLMSLKELAEWLEAHVQESLEAAADAWGDRCYLLLGDAVSSGLAVESIFAEVHRSNLTKAPARQTDGKGEKGGNFEPPRWSFDSHESVRSRIETSSIPSTHDQHPINALDV